MKGGGDREETMEARRPWQIMDRCGEETVTWRDWWEGNHAEKGQ